MDGGAELEWTEAEDVSLRRCSRDFVKRVLRHGFVNFDSMIRSHIVSVD
jgi:hypothetical protein